MKNNTVLSRVGGTVILITAITLVALLIWYVTTGQEKFEEVNFPQDETNKKIASFEKNKKECSNQAISEEIYDYVINKDSKRPFGR